MAPKKNKQPKAVTQKSQQDRLAECVSLRMQMRDLGIDGECRVVHEKMQEFVKHGTTASGSILLPSCGRRFVYMLSHKQDCQAALLRQGS